MAPSPSSPKALGVTYHLTAYGLPRDRPAIGDVMQFRVSRVAERDYLPAGVMIDVDLEFVADASPQCAARRDRFPYIVGDSRGATEAGQLTPVFGAFVSEEMAARFIETLPDYLSGRYFLDGPSDDAEPIAESDAMRDEMRNHACDILLGAIGKCPSKPDAAAGEDPGACLEIADAFADIADRFLARGSSTERR